MVICAFFYVHSEDEYFSQSLLRYLDCGMYIVLITIEFTPEIYFFILFFGGSKFFFEGVKFSCGRPPKKPSWREPCSCWHTCYDIQSTITQLTILFCHCRLRLVEGAIPSVLRPASVHKLPTPCAVRRKRRRELREEQSYIAAAMSSQSTCE